MRKTQVQGDARNRSLETHSPGTIQIDPNSVLATEIKLFVSMAILTNVESSIAFYSFDALIYRFHSVTEWHKLLGLTGVERLTSCNGYSSI